MVERYAGALMRSPKRTAGTSGEWSESSGVSSPSYCPKQDEELVMRYSLIARAIRRRHKKHHLSKRIADRHEEEVKGVSLQPGCEEPQGERNGQRGQRT